MPPAARVGDPTGHPGVIGPPGVPTVLIAGHAGGHGRHAAHLLVPAARGAPAVGDRAAGLSDGADRRHARRAGRRHGRVRRPDHRGRPDRADRRLTWRMEFVGAGMAFPMQHRRHRRDRPRRPGTGDRGGDPADPRHDARGSGRCGRSSAAGSRDHVFAPANATTAGQLPTTCGRRSTSGSRGSTSTTSRCRFDATDSGVLYIDITYRIRGTNDPRNLVFPFYVIPQHEPTRLRVASADGRELTWSCPPRISTTATSRTLVDDAKRLVQQRSPDWTDHNVSRPGRHADRGVRPDGGPADLPAEPGPGPALRQVPRADRPAAATRRPPRGAR